jgi:succinate-semialdehyde dehydrogenase/glutarate-semialdehyde dehydrogenase
MSDVMSRPVLEIGAFIGGSEEPLGDDTMEIRDPASGEVVGRVTNGGPADADRAVRAAAEAFGEWSARSVADRGHVVMRVSGAIREHEDELAPLLTAEQGKPLRESRLELRRAAETLEHYAGLAKQLRGGHVLGLDPGVSGQILRRPLGVVVAIVPWNFPTTLLCNKLGPALVAGNTVVAKPADTTPLTTLRLAAIAHEAGLPAGVLNVLPGTGPGAGEALVTHPLVRKVAFTGSTPTGERIMALAARGTKRVTLELGGSDPLIICDDADVPAAVSAASMGRFFNCGQACLAVKRVYVFESVFDEVVDTIAGKARKLRLGPGDAEGVQLGPLHSEGQRSLLEDQLARTLDAGGPAADALTRPSCSAGTSTSRRSSRRPRTTRRWRSRRSSDRCCLSGRSRTSTRRSSGPTPRSSAWARRCGRVTSTAPPSQPSAWSAATPG